MRQVFIVTVNGTFHSNDDNVTVTDIVEQLQSTNCSIECEGTSIMVVNVHEDTEL